MRTDLVVISPPPTSAGEQFAILRPDAILSMKPSEETDEPPPPWGGRSAWERAMKRFLEGAEWLTEAAARTKLADLGLSSDEVDDQLRRARAIRSFNEQSTWESTTAIGFRNVHRQEVARKTEQPGRIEGQRLYVLRCGDCGHEHESDGHEIHLRRCPSCQ